MPGLASPHVRYLTLVDEIEHRFPVARWHAGDLDIWPLARMDLYLDLVHSSGGETAATPPPSHQRAIANLATPIANIWKSRHDLRHWVSRPRRAYAAMLGDGVSLDCVGGAWRDRYGEAIISMLERQGHGTFLMQSGNLARLPWHRPTFAANLVSVWGGLAGRFGPAGTMELPDHGALLGFLAQHGVDAPSLRIARLAHRVRNAAASAAAFERLLAVVRPKLAFVTTYYAGLGHAFVLACRRRGILSVDLQHCPQEGAHKAYSWHALPEHGFSTLPALFWTWKEEDAAHVRGWANRIGQPWHRALHGGHTQLAAFLDDDDPGTLEWDRAFAEIGAGPHYQREILVALQPIGGHRALWDGLADRIEASPRSWRWWIRRHPASAPVQNTEYARLLALDRPDVMVEEASRFPLPALLRHMHVLISLASGAAGEAAAFGVPAFFLSDAAHGPFGELIRRGEAQIVSLDEVSQEIAGTSTKPVRTAAYRPPPIADTLRKLESIADDYARLCRSTGSG